MENNGTKYVQYVSAGDDKVRPEHEMRNGKIYRIENAPFMGEYNCRCTLVPADYLVKNGAEYNTSDAEYIPTEPAKPTKPEKVTVKKPTVTKPDIKTHTKFTTVKDAEAYAKSRIPQADYTGLDVKTANTLNESLDYHIKLNPKTCRSMS